MKPVMYIFANKGVGMSAPKLAAQVAHAAVEAFRISKPEMLDEWYKGGHYTKIVLEARDEEHLRNIREYLMTRGFNVVTIIDEGRTEINPHTLTALGVEVVNKDDEHTALTFSDFKTYRENKPAPKRRIF